MKISKKYISLKEDGNAYVKSSTGSQSSMGSDINKAKAQNPMDNDIHVDLQTYDGNKSNDPVTIDVNAENGNDAQNQIKDIMKKPGLQNIASKGQMDAVVHLKEEKTIKFTKRDFDIFLNSI